MREAFCSPVFSCAMALHGSVKCSQNFVSCCFSSELAVSFLLLSCFGNDSPQLFLSLSRMQVVLSSQVKRLLVTLQRNLMWNQNHSQKRKRSAR